MPDTDELNGARGAVSVTTESTRVPTANGPGVPPVDGSTSFPLTTGSACADARHWTVAQLERLGVASTDLRDDAELVVSELVSNALQHGAPPIVVTVSGAVDDVVVSVADTGGPPYVFSSLPPHPTGAHGRGLAIVAVVATAWGVSPCDPGPGKAVWGRLRHTDDVADR